MIDQRKFAISVVVFIAIALVAVSALSSIPFAHAPPNPITWAARRSVPYTVAQAGVIGGRDGRIYVMGGYSGGSPFNTARAYDPRTDSWANLTSMGTPTRGPGIAVDGNGLIYVISGYSGSGDITNNQVYNVTSNTWTAGTSVATPVWMPGATTGIDGRIYLVGGETSGGVATNILQIYNPQTHVWSSGAGMTTARKQFQAVAAPNGFIYAIGGLTGSSVATTSVEGYNVTGNVWIARASLPSPVMVFGAALGPDGLIYVFGGSTSYSNNNSPFFNTVYSYDPIGNTWYNNTATPLPTARREVSAATSNYNNHMYVIGGANGAYLSTNEEATVPPRGHTTTSAITCSPTTIIAGNVTSCTVTVTDTNATLPTTPTGTVTLLTSGTGSFTTCTLSGILASATCNTTYTANSAGGITLTAHYPGDSTHSPSSPDGTTSLTVTPRTSTVSINCHPTTIVVSNSTSCTVNVTDTSTVGTVITPSGTIGLSSSGTGSFTTCTLAGSGAVATCSTTYRPTVLGTGSHMLTGHFGGDAAHSTASPDAAFTIIVTVRSTITSVTCTSPAIIGSATNCTVTVTDNSPGPFMTPTSSVGLATTGTGPFTGTCTLTGTTASATCSVTYVPGGSSAATDTITGDYPGDINHSASSGTFPLTVITAPPPPPDEPPVAIMLTITPNPSQQGQPITFSGTGTDNDGNIAAYQWRSSISGAISTSASFTTNNLPAGTHTIYFSVQDTQGGWSNEASTVITITPGTAGSSGELLGLSTIYWILIALALAGVGALFSILVATKKRKKAAPYSSPSPVAPPPVAPAPPANPAQ